MAGLGDVMSIVGSVVGLRSGTEEPKSEVIDKLGEHVEIRRYPELAAVETSSLGSNREQFSSTAFGRLFRYISGANAGAAKIAMTTPVEQQGTAIAMTRPVETRGQGGAMTMRFFLPSQYNVETAPKPTDPAVRIARIPSRDVAVYRFSGFVNESTIAEAGAALNAEIARSGWKPAGPLYTMLYDPPFSVPFLRRNEVAMEVTKRPEKAP